ncbi:MAG: AlpA family phage regulatory protein [Deltaproteobacteria bacterium]|nr:AlpA family phage regulatory protein [Deltaproteobacteria bacterium]
MQTKLIRIRDVKDATGLSTTSLYRLIAAESFPKPIKLTERTSAWVADEVEKWCKDKIAERNRNVAAAVDNGVKP